MFRYFTQGMKGSPWTSDIGPPSLGPASMLETSGGHPTGMFSSSVVHKFSPTKNTCIKDRPKFIGGLVIRCEAPS